MKVLLLQKININTYVNLQNKVYEILSISSPEIQLSSYTRTFKKKLKSEIVDLNSDNIDLTNNSIPISPIPPLSLVETLLPTDHNMSISHYFSDQENLYRT